MQVYGHALMVLSLQVHPKLLTEALITASGAEVVLAKVVGGRTRCCAFLRISNKR